MVCVARCVLCTLRAVGMWQVSRIGNFLACCLLLCSRIELRNCARALPVVQPHILRLAVVGELLSVCGVGISMFSISIFSQPAVVNAAEGGMQQRAARCVTLYGCVTMGFIGIQQLLNLLFACIACRLGFGRKVKQRIRASLSSDIGLRCRSLRREEHCAKLSTHAGGPDDCQGHLVRPGQYWPAPLHILVGGSSLPRIRASDRVSEDASRSNAMRSAGFDLGCGTRTQAGDDGRARHAVVRYVGSALS
jgi:hypothetical protein